MRVSGKIRCALVLALQNFAAFAYEPTTHEVMTQIAAQRSNVYADPALLTDLGLTASTTFTETNILGQSVANLDAKGIIGRGAVLEDYYEQNCSWRHPTTLGWMRVFNHFFDPQHNGRALTVAVPIGLPSPDWALEDGGDVTTTAGPCAQSGRAQTYSYRQAQQHLYNSFTGQSASYRQQEISIAMQTLGHVVHH